MGGERAGAFHQRMAAPFPRRRTREGRQRGDRHRHRHAQFDFVGRRREQSAPGQSSGQAAAAMDEGERDDGQQDLSRGEPCAAGDLSESAAPEPFRGVEQWLHLPRVRLPEQRAPGAEAARLGRGGREHAAVVPLAGQGGGSGIFWGGLGVC